MHVIEYDGKSLLGFDENKGSVGSQIDPKNQPSCFDQLRRQSIPAEHPSMDLNSGLSMGGTYLSLEMLVKMSIFGQKKKKKERRDGCLIILCPII